MPSVNPGAARRDASSLCAVATRCKVPMFLSERSVPDEQQVIDSIQVCRAPLLRVQCPPRMLLLGMFESGAVDLVRSTSKHAVATTCAQLSMTVACAQRWLAMPYSGSLTEDDMARQPGDDNGQRTDPDFPPQPQSLYRDLQHPPANAPAGADWKRVNGTLYVPSSQSLKVLPVRTACFTASRCMPVPALSQHPSCALRTSLQARHCCIQPPHTRSVLPLQRPSVFRHMQGGLRDRWFLGAMACVASRRDLVLDLIVSDNMAPKGLYTFQFYKHGCWHQVTVDDFLPCVLGQDEVLFACSGTAGAHPWPQIQWTHFTDRQCF